MAGFNLPTQSQVVESCNSVESVLDALHDHTSLKLQNRSTIFSPVKDLFTSLQRLEGDKSKVDGAFHTADTRAKHNLAGILTNCRIVAGQLRIRIDSNALRDDDNFAIELMTMTNEIEDFLKLRKKIPAATSRPKPGTAADSSELVEDLLRKQQKHQSEVEGLELEIQTLYRRERTFEDEILALRAELTAKNKVIDELQNHNDSKLSHIRRLHAAVSNLGLRHPMTHQTYDWDDLTDELPAMLQRTENINAKLKELELERDRINDEEQDSEDMAEGGVPSAPKPPSAVNASKLPNRQKDKGSDKEKDAKRKTKENRRSADAKPYTKARSLSPPSSEASKANTSNSLRIKSRKRW